VIDAVHQHAHPEHVGSEDELLALVRTQLAGAGEPVDGGHPFLLGRLDLAHEGMQMRDQRAHDMAQPRVGNGLPALAHDIGQVRLGHEWHDILSRR